MAEKCKGVRFDPLLPSSRRSVREDDDEEERPSRSTPQHISPRMAARHFSLITARKVLSRKASSIVEQASDIEFVHDLVESADLRDDARGIVWPWNPFYRIWRHLTALGAFATIFLAPYQVAFDEGEGAGRTLEAVMTILFAGDIVVNFNLARYREGKVVYDRREIAAEYARGTFWVDVVGAFPFQGAALAVAGDRVDGSDGGRAYLMISLLRLLRAARLHRIKDIVDELRYNSRVSLLWLTLFRNLAVVVIACHCEACCMYFLARLKDFDDTTWLGSVVKSEEGGNLYVTSLYWSITTFCTVGYGDFAPANPAEEVAGSIFMIFNIAISAWIIGSITLLMLRGDEKTREYRDTLEVLHQYGHLHELEPPLLDKLKGQLKLEFTNRETADEQVLKNFPSAIRRKVLRRLYKEFLVNTPIMEGIPPQFVDAFLISSTIEIFSPGEEIVERGSVQSDLFLLVGGIAEIAASQYTDTFWEGTEPHSTKFEAGEFVGAIGFFTESPQIVSVNSLTAVKTLTMSRSTYKLLAQDHPGSVSKILQNLLAHVENISYDKSEHLSMEVMQEETGYDSFGSRVKYDSFGTGPACGDRERNDSMTAIRSLVTMHMRKTLDDETTRLLFAASRGDTRQISSMCDYGFDPNNVDYDKRTALMVAAMKGNYDVVELLLRYNACPNKIDMHGSSALMEAVKSGNEDIMQLLLQHGAKLGVAESSAASVLCQAVFDGDVLLMKRLLKAGIDANAADYDKRTASHVAVAEGNTAAIRVLTQHGADLSLPDRWGDSVQDLASKSNMRF
ncbi:hypothetical protein ACHAWF_016336 [Thalassiosira exigua]